MRLISVAKASLFGVFSLVSRLNRRRMGVSLEQSIVFSYEDRRNTEIYGEGFC